MPQSNSKLNKKFKPFIDKLKSQTEQVKLEDQFEVDNSTKIKPPEDKKWGLSVRKGSSNDSNAPKTETPTSGEVKVKEEPVVEKSIEEQALEELEKDAEKNSLMDLEEMDLPLILKYRNNDLDEIEDETERFRMDVRSRPDEASLDQYNQIPVDSFGPALLRGMGWEPGQPIGLTNKAVVQPYELLNRPGYRTGLGAEALPVQKKEKKYIKPGESREPKPLMGLAPDPSGKIRHIKTLDEKLVPLPVLKEGALVSIVAGRHDGMNARVLQMNKENLLVRLESSEEEVTVAKDDITLINEYLLNESHPALDFIAQQQKRDADEEKERQELKKKQQKELSEQRSKPPSDGTKRTTAAPAAAAVDKMNPQEQRRKIWVFPHIVVRLVDKTFSNGKYYLKKGRVEDVFADGNCTLLLEGKLLDVNQKMLETVIPDAEGKVMVVRGAQAGKVGKVLEKTKEKGEKRVITQLLGDLSVHSFDLDSISQYTGVKNE